MGFDKLMTLVPVNRQASIVTSNSSNPDSEAEELRARWKEIEKAIIRNKSIKFLSKDELKSLTEEKVETQAKLTEIRGKTKNDARLNGQGHIYRYFVDACQEELHPLVFRRIMQTAIDNRDKEKQNDR